MMDKLEIGDILELQTSLFCFDCSNTTFLFMVAANNHKVVQIVYNKLLFSTGTFMEALICGKTRKFKVMGVYRSYYHLDAIY